MRTKKSSLIAIFLGLTLIFNSNHIVADNNTLNNTSLATVAAGVGVIGAIVMLLSSGGDDDNKNNPSTQTMLPAISSASNYNLLSLNGKKAEGKIIVKNTADQTVQQFDITSNNNAAAATTTTITIDPSSSCFQPTPAGGQCEFNIAYQGTGLGTELKRIPVRFEVGKAGSETSDFLTVNAIDAPLKTFFRPYADETEAHTISGNITSLITVNKNGEYFLYAGTDTGNIFKSSDHGNHWIAVNNGLENSSTSTILCLHKNVLYAGMFSTGKVFMSIDGGASWTFAGKPGLTMVEDLYSDGNTLYAAAHTSGIYKYNENENNWGKIGNLVADSSAVILHNGELYTGTNTSPPGITDGVYKYNESTSEWNKVGILSAEIYILYSHNNTLYAGLGYDGSSSGGVYKLEGENWIQVGSALQTKIVSSLSYFAGQLYAGTNSGVYKYNESTQDWELFYLNSTSINTLSSDGKFLYVGTRNNYGYKFDGNSWTTFNYGLTNLNIQSIQLNANDGTLYVGTSNGVFKSNNDGIDWTPMSDNLPTGTVYSLKYLENDGSLYAGVSTKGVYKYDINGNTWRPWPSQSSTLANRLVQSLHFFDGFLYAATSGAGVYRYNNNNWQQYPATSSVLISKTVRSLYSSNNILYAGTSDFGVYKYDNNSNNWVAVPTTGSSLANKTVVSLSEITSGTDIGLYAGATPAYIATDSGVYIYNNNQLERFPIGDTVLKNKTIKSLYTIADGAYTGLYVIAGASSISSMIYKYNTTSHQWEKFGFTTPNPPYGTAYTLVYYGGFLYLGSNNGIWKYDGSQWIQFASTSVLSGVSVSLLYSIADGQEEWLYAVSNGIYKYNNIKNNWDLIGPTLLGSGLSATQLYSITTGDYAGFYAATSFGVYKYNCNDWILIGPTLSGKIIYSLYLVKEGAYMGFYAATTDGIYKYNGSDWSQAGTNKVAATTLSLGTDNFLYAGTNVSQMRSNSGIYKYDGNSWVRAETSPTIKGINSLLLNDNNLYVGISHTEYRSPGVYKFDNNWSQLGSQIKDKEIISLVSLYESLYAGASGSYFNSPASGIYNYSGNDWNLISTELPPPTTLLFNVNNNTLYVTSTNGLWKAMFN